MQTHRLLHILIGTGAVCSALMLGMFLSIIHAKVIDFSVLENYNPGLPSILLDDHGNELTRFQLDRRDPIRLEAMPDHLINAFIAAEDWNFLHHAGISIKGIIRSTLVNLYHGRIVQGASTITQQLVKLLFFDAQRTFKRKIKEQLYALIVEHQFTKDQILETYLNHIYFGCGIYGVEAAAQRFWGIHASELTIDQAATLAGIVRSPGQYCPLTHPLSCQRRRNIILQSMHNLNFIDKTAREQAQAMPLTMQRKDASELSHVREMFRLLLEEQVGKVALYCGGLTIQTTLNKDIQQEAEQIFKKQCAQLRTSINEGIDGALITIEVKTGNIKALVGGYDFSQSKWNRALQAKRQMGSTFKPLIYAAALMKGLSFSDVVVDEPVEIVQANRIWRPKNVHMQFHGSVTLAYALSHSLNSIPIKLLSQIGYDPIISLAHRCHVQRDINPYPSLALGCLDATVKEVAGMFNIFANNGYYIEPHCILWIKDRWGNKFYKPSYKPELVLTSRITGQVAKVLELGLKRVQKLFPQPWISCQAISKTGTTNDSRTCWYVGATPEYTTAVYIGADDNRALGKDVYPLSTAFPIWLALNRTLPITQATFVYDPSLHELYIDELAGYQTYKDRAGSIPILL